MKLIKFAQITAVTAMAAILSTGAHARGTATGTVDKITASGSVTNIFLSESITAVTGETIPSCSTRDDFFTLASDQKNQLAIILTALALGSEVKINGNGQCNNKSNAEDISSVQVIGG